VTVEAIRDTLVAEVTRAAAIELVGRHPHVLGPLVMKIVRRSGQGLGARSRRTVALAVTADVDPRSFASRLQTEIARDHTCAHVWSGWVDARPTQPGAADATPGHPVEARLAKLLHEIGLSHDHVIFETDRMWSSWSDTVAGYADRLVACTSPDPGASEAGIVDRLFAAGPPHAERVLVVIHPPDADRPRDQRAMGATTEGEPHRPHPGGVLRGHRPTVPSSHRQVLRTRTGRWRRPRIRPRRSEEGDDGAGDPHRHDRRNVHRWRTRRGSPP